MSHELYLLGKRVLVRWKEKKGDIPSVVAVYPGLARFPIVHAPGHYKAKLRVVPLNIAGRAIPQVNCLPEGVFAGVEHMP